MGVKTGEAKEDCTGGLLECLTPEQARRLRAKAWRHVRRINSKVAREVWHMSLNRYATKRDAVEPDIIDAVTKAGWHCWQLDYPVDLLLWKEGRGFVLMEVKTGKGKNLRVYRDKRQEAQANFVNTTRTPIVRTPTEALEALGATDV